tara:strand:- start:242 stop:409 length:168 start_codon:yes stop_codon:yes gene_type:complete
MPHEKADETIIFSSQSEDVEIDYCKVTVFAIIVLISVQDETQNLDAVVFGVNAKK